MNYELGSVLHFAAAEDRWQAVYVAAGGAETVEPVIGWAVVVTSVSPDGTGGRTALVPMVSDRGRKGRPVPATQYSDAALTFDGLRRRTVL